MTTNNDVNKKFYFDLVPDEEIQGIFEEIGTTKCHCTLWQKDKEDKAEEFESLSYDSKTSKLYLEKLASGLIGTLLPCKFLNQKVFIKIEYKKLFLFTTVVLEREKDEEKRYFFEFKDKLYKSTQRSNYRLQASKNVNVQIKINEEIFDCCDISAGGTSFSIDPSLDEDFNKNDKFIDCDILFNRKKFNIPEVTVMGKWEEKSPKTDKLVSLKLGVAFTKLPSGTEENLFKHVNSEARAEEIRKKLIGHKPSAKPTNKLITKPIQDSGDEPVKESSDTPSEDEPS